MRWREVSTEPSCFSPARAPQQDLSQCHLYGPSEALGLPLVLLQPLVPPGERGHRGFCALGSRFLLPPGDTAERTHCRGLGPFPKPGSALCPGHTASRAMAAPEPAAAFVGWGDGGDGESVPQCRTQHEEGGARTPRGSVTFLLLMHSQESSYRDALLPLSITELKFR